MKAVQTKLNEQPTSNPVDNGVLVKDLIQYFSILAKLSDEEKTGNPELARGLRDLTRSLRPFSNRHTSELPSILNSKDSTNNRRNPSAKNKVDLPTELDHVSHNDIERILEDDRYTKAQLAELGFRRFGISRASLIHSSKKDAVESVRTALGNERTLDTVARVALKAGQARTS